MQVIKTDILISGGGVAGLAAACAFGSAGFLVTIVDPAPPVIDGEADGADLRTTAFLQPSRTVLERAGVWSRLAPHASALQVMQIIDAGGPEPVARVQKAFDAQDISDAPFGWNLPNWLLRREFLGRIDELENVSFLSGVGTKAVLTRRSEARVTLTDGSRYSARLLIGADGRSSPVREAVGINVRTTRYGQKALAFAVTHPVAHNNVSTEIHRSGGPFTLVPLPDRDGSPCSAIVWMERGPEAKRLAALPIEDFETEMNARSTGLLGTLKLVSRRSVWPIITQIADRMWAERTALIAEAAHVVPPIGAQGLNMSLGDVRVLLELAEGNPEELGSPGMLETYHRRRHPEVQMRVSGIDILNRASMVDAQPLRDARAQGLKALYSLAPVRKSLMKLGLGVR